MPEVRVTGLLTNASGVRLAQAIQRGAGLTLRPAVDYMNRMWSGEVVTIEVPTVEMAERLRRELEGAKAIVELVPNRAPTANAD